MSAHFAQARGCQLYQQDLQRILLLSSRIIATQAQSADSHALKTNDNHSPGVHSSSSSSVTDEEKILLPSVVAGLLSEAHVRELVAHTLVRVAVPRNKYDALLRSNPFVQDMQEQMQKKSHTTKSESMHHNSNSHDNNSAEQNESVMMTHRVGRVIALLPKPEMPAASPSVLIGVHASGSHNSAGVVLNRWLIAVHVGESVELLAVRHISQHGFTDEEYRVYTRSTLASLNRVSSSTTTSRLVGHTVVSGRPSSNSGGRAALLLSAEEAEAKRATLQSLRIALHFIYTTSSASSPLAGVADSANAASETADGVADAGTTLTRMTTQAVQMWGSAHSALKRERETSTTSPTREDRWTSVKDEATLGEQTDMFARASMRHDNSNSKSKADKNTNQDGDGAALKLLVRDQNRQLQQLRALLHTREEDLSQQEQTQRQITMENSRTIAQWRSKLDEESRTRARMQDEMNTTLQEQKTLLEQANAKLRRLAEMTTRYKRVADEVRTRLEETVRQAEGDGESGGGVSVQLGTPEAILGMLKKVKLSM